jgi:hypothetical protein
LSAPQSPGVHRHSQEFHKLLALQETRQQFWHLHFSPQVRAATIAILVRPIHKAAEDSHVSLERDGLKAVLQQHRFLALHSFIKFGPVVGGQVLPARFKLPHANVIRPHAGDC